MWDTPGRLHGSGGPGSAGGPPPTAPRCPRPSPPPSPRGRGRPGLPQLPAGLPVRSRGCRRGHHRAPAGGRRLSLHPGVLVAGLWSVGVRPQFILLFLSRRATGQGRGRSGSRSGPSRGWPRTAVGGGPKGRLAGAGAGGHAQRVCGISTAPTPARCRVSPAGFARAPGGRSLRCRDGFRRAGPSPMPGKPPVPPGWRRSRARRPPVPRH